MVIYIVRHGEAYDIGERNIETDRDRMLTPRGETQSARVGKLLSFLDAEPGLVFTSPYVRAKRTAEYAMSEMKRKPELREAVGLAPGGTVGEVLQALLRVKEERIMLVGHEPLLGTLVQFFLNGVADPHIALSKGSIACLETEELNGGPARFRWLLNSALMKDILKGTAD